MPRLLILAQFAPAYLERLRRRFEVFHESWLDTAELVDPETLGERLRLVRGTVDFDGKKIPRDKVVSGPYMWVDAELVDASNVDKFIK